MATDTWKCMPCTCACNQCNAMYMYLEMHAMYMYLEMHARYMCLEMVVKYTTTQ